MKRLKFDWGKTYLILIVLFIYSPIFAVILLSFSKTIYLQFPPKLFSLHWFNELFRNTRLLNSFMLSLRVAIPATLISTLCGTLVAVGHRKLSGKYASFSKLLFIGPLVVPYVTLAIGMSVVFTTFRISRINAIMLAHAAISLPYVYLLVLSGIKLLPDYAEEAATVLGADKLTVLTRITLPLLKVHILAGMAFAFIASFGEFIIAYMLSGPTTTLLTVYIYSSVREKTEPSISALLTLITIVIIFLAFIYTKYFVSRAKRV